MLAIEVKEEIVTVQSRYHMNTLGTGIEFHGISRFLITPGLGLRQLTYASPLIKTKAES